MFQLDTLLAPGSTDFRLDTDSVTVTFFKVNGGVSNSTSSDARSLAGIDTFTLGALDAKSSRDSAPEGQGTCNIYLLGFSVPVGNVSFRVDDSGDMLRVQAFDSGGNPIEVTLEEGEKLTLLGSDGVDLEGTYPERSLSVTIPGPVSEIKILHIRGGSKNFGISLADVYFDTTAAAGDIGASDHDDFDGETCDDPFLCGEDDGDIIGGRNPGNGDVGALDHAGSKVFATSLEPGTVPITDTTQSGRVVYFADDTKTILKREVVFKELESVIPCFTPGATIATPRGEIPVGSLREGDKVITRDNGIQEVRWAGSRTLYGADLTEDESLKPILIKAGCLGRNLPERDMLVSPEHRVLVTGDGPRHHFDESEVLVAAKHLLGKPGVGVVDAMRTTYIHFMFDRHEVVLSDGAWTESFQPGDQSLGSMGEATREEIFALFPELATRDGLTDYAAARRSLQAHEAKLLYL